MNTADQARHDEAPRTPAHWPTPAERMAQALRAIAGMRVDTDTNHAQLSALCITIARVTLDAVGGDDANAQLIAAAPDMLSALQYVLGEAMGQHADPEATLAAIAGQVRAAIARAEGR